MANTTIPGTSLIRRPDKKNRTYIDNEYFENGYARIFPHSTYIVYCLLCKFANYKTQLCFPTADTLMKLSGIKNRNTLFNSLKYLESFNLIKTLHHSKGRIPNEYTMIDSSQWEEIDDIKFDTVKKQISVSKKISKQYQNEPVNSIASDTPSNISNLYKEIKEENNFLKEEMTNKKGISSASFRMLSLYFEEKDVLNAYNEISSKDKDEASFKKIQTLLKSWASEGKIATKQKMNW